MVEITDLNHINIVVKDVEASKRFYCDVLGMENVPCYPSFTFPDAWLRRGSAEIHLIQQDVATHAPGDLGHSVAASTDKDLAFSRYFSLVIDDTDALVEHLQAHDVALAFGRWNAAADWSRPTATIVMGT